MQFHSQNSSGGGNQSKYTPKNRNNQGAKKQSDKLPPTTQSNVGWGNLYADKDAELSKKGNATNSGSTTSNPKNEKFKPFIPGNQNQSSAPKSEMNELQQMMSESASNTKKNDKKGAKAEPMIDDAILSIDASIGGATPTRPPTFSNKNNPKNKKEKDANFALQTKNFNPQKTSGGQKKERQLTKTHSSWVTGDKGASLNELMQTESGSYDQFADKNTTYDESLYNTTYDITKFSKEQIATAHRVEREIINKDAKGNIHLAEERGQVLLRDNENEEIMYSGVIRNEPKQTTSLKNPKKFKCVRKTLVAFPHTKNQMSSSFVGGLLNPGQWVSFDLNEDLKPVSSQSGAKQNQNKQNTNLSSSSQLQAPKTESVTGIYKGGGYQQISNTQTAYIKQQTNQQQFQAQAQTPTLKMPQTGFKPSVSAQPFVPKQSQPFQPKEEIKQTQAPSYTPNQSYNQNQYQEFKPKQQQPFKSFTPNSQMGQNEQSQAPSYTGGNNYQNRQMNQYQNQSNQGNNQYHGSSYKQSYSNQNANYHGQKHNNYQNTSYQNNNYDYSNNQKQSHSFVNQNQSYQQNQYRPVNNTQNYQKNNYHQSQQQWGQGNLYHPNQNNQNNYSMNTHHDLSNQNGNMQFQGRQQMNNNYNSSHGSQAQISQTGGFHSNSSQMKVGPTFNPSGM